MARYSKDPRTITVKYDGKCAGCSAVVKAGRLGFYYPIGRHLYGHDCGCAEQREADFAAAAFDEAQYSGSW